MQHLVSCPEGKTPFRAGHSHSSLGPSSCTRDGWFRLPSIDQYSLLLPPVGVGTVSQFPCGGSSSQTPYPS
ncbi:hypothetical protein B566_EDAN019442 [Ephemera danica]|nr:hypothetical protein B566_EDAN019442 [Ephemera danica]